MSCGFSQLGWFAGDFGRLDAAAADGKLDRTKAVRSSPRVVDWRRGWGVFVEITKHEAPDYYVEIRHESGGMWTEGWVRYGTRDSHPLSAAAIGGYGGEELYVYTGVAITAQKQGVAQR